jgi:hypothetical protein
VWRWDPSAGGCGAQLGAEHSRAKLVLGCSHVQGWVRCRWLRRRILTALQNSSLFKWQVHVLGRGRSWREGGGWVLLPQQ